MQQIKGELLIRMNVELLHIDLWEDIERGLGLDCRNARNLIEHVVDEIALIMDPSSGNQIVLDALMSTQGGLHD